MAILDFEEVNATTETIEIPDGYYGLNFENIYSLNPLLFGYSNSGYNNAIHSGETVGYGGFAMPATVSSDLVDFDFNGGFFAAAWSDKLKVTIEGWDDGVLVSSTTFKAKYTGKYYSFDGLFDSVDKIVISSSGGKDHDPGDDGSGSHVCFDDLDIFMHWAGEAAARKLAVIEAPAEVVAGSSLGLEHHSTSGHSADYLV